MPSFDPRLAADHADHLDYVSRMNLVKQHFETTSESIRSHAVKNWDKFLTEEEDTRDPIDEQWRSRIIIPSEFVTTRTKAAQHTELLGNTEPPWQVEASRDEPGWYEQSKPMERLLGHMAYHNAWRKFIYKTSTQRSVMGTVFVKLTWERRAHTIRAVPNDGDQARFMDSVEKAQQAGAPVPPDWQAQPDEFDAWRKTVNLANMHGSIPTRPRTEPGYEDIVEYEGPILRTPSLWSVYLDPLIDEMRDQKVIIHRVVKPLSYVLSRADDDPNSDMPYLLKNVEKAQTGWDGQILLKEEQQMAEKMGVVEQQTSHPYYKDPVVLWEVWSYDEKFKHAIIMNPVGADSGGVVINKRPFEHPLLTTVPNIFALRNIMVPGHMYGKSDYHAMRYLSEELNRFRRLRMDRATLTTLPIFVKMTGVRIGEQLRKISPGMVLEAPVKDGITALIKDTVPPEGYREPAEIKLEIADATGVSAASKGMDATVGRVTGTEFSGRAGATQLQFKVDTSFFEDEIKDLPTVALSMYAQMAPDQVRIDIGGSPDSMITVAKADIVKMIGTRFRMRGATKNIDPNLAVQQITTLLRSVPPNVISPTEYRAFVEWAVDELDYKGTESILAPATTQQVQGASDATMQAGVAQANAQTLQAGAATNPAPSSLPMGEAGALTGSAPAPTPQGGPAPPAPTPAPVPQGGPLA